MDDDDDELPWYDRDGYGWGGGNLPDMMSKKTDKKEKCAMKRYSIIFLSGQMSSLPNKVADSYLSPNLVPGAGNMVTISQYLKPLGSNMTLQPWMIQGYTFWKNRNRSPMH